MKTISANMNVMIMACEKASKTLIRDFGEIEKLQVSVKGPSDFVSSADKKVEQTLISELKKSRPNYSILSEEIGEIKSENSEYKWIIDPIDGTLNFLHGIPIVLFFPKIFLYSSKLNSLSLDLKVGPPVNIMQSFNFFLLDTFIL